MESTILYEDAWGEIIDRPGPEVIEIRWFDTTSDMTGEQFKDWLSSFAGHVERSSRRRCLVDARQFEMPHSRMDGAWRDEHIIPRYDAAGVTGFAFLVSPDMPLVGKPPSADGPAGFPTGFFGRRVDALDWLGSR